MIEIGPAGYGRPPIATMVGTPAIAPLDRQPRAAPDEHADHY